MPIIKSAIKRMKQNRTSRARNRHYGSHMKSMIKLLLGYVEKGEMEKAKKLLPEVISAIDTAAKKNLIHQNNAAHKKSRVQKAVTTGPPKKEEKPVKAKASKKDVKAEKKVKDKPLDEKVQTDEVTEDSTDAKEEEAKKDE